MPTTSVASPKREYFPRAQRKYRAWRFWQALWKWTNLIVGGSIAGLSVVIATNIEIGFLGTMPNSVLAILAAVLAFAQTALQPSAQAAACEVAARELEKAIERHQADPTKDDVFLVDAVDRGIDLLTRVKST